jgi:hypothetical protein
VGTLPKSDRIKFTRLSTLDDGFGNYVPKRVLALCQPKFPANGLEGGRHYRNLMLLERTVL